MKRTMIFVGLVAAVSMLWFGALHAANVRSGQSPTVMSDETVNGTLYASGDVIKIDGTVQGDLLCAAQTLTITGTVEGDVLCAAQVITISGHVEGSVRSLAQTITVDGKVDGSASIAGMTVGIGKDAVIGHDLTIGSQQATLEGQVGRDTTFVGSSVTSNGKVGRDLDITGQNVTLDSKASVGGDFRYVSDSDVKKSDGATIGGKTDHRIPDHSKPTGIMPPAVYVSAILFGLISFLVLGVALLTVTPRFVDSAVRQLKTAPFGALGVGLVGLIVIPLTAVVLIVGIVGIPLGIAMFLTWMLAMLCGFVFAALRIGQMVLPKNTWPETWQHIASLVSGLLIIFIVSLIPYVGGLVVFASIVWGAGAVWYAIIKNRMSPKVAESVKGKA